MREKYTEEFNRNITKLREIGKSVGEISREYGIAKLPFKYFKTEKVFIKQEMDLKAKIKQKYHQLQQKLHIGNFRFDAVKTRISRK